MLFSQIHFIFTKGSTTREAQLAIIINNCVSFYLFVNFSKISMCLSRCEPQVHFIMCVRSYAHVSTDDLLLPKYNKACALSSSKTTFSPRRPKSCKKLPFFMTKECIYLLGSSVSPQGSGTHLQNICYFGRHPTSGIVLDYENLPRTARILLYSALHTRSV